VKLIFPPPPAGHSAGAAQTRRGHRAVPPCDSRGEIIRQAMREDDEDRVLRDDSQRNEK
jgi:hypothetical protein